MFHIIASLFCLCYTATSYCLGTAIIGATLLENFDTLLIAIMLEAIFYHIVLQTYYKNALLYSGIGNSISMTIFLTAIISSTTITSLFQSMPNNIIAPELLFFILLIITTTIIKLFAMQRISGYSMKELKYPVLIGNVILFTCILLHPGNQAILTYIVKSYMKIH